MTSERSSIEAGTELQLSEETRRQLGLEAEEGVRLLRADGPTIVIERSAAMADPAALRNSDLVLIAELGSFPLSEVIGLIHDARKSGLLTFHQGQVEKTIFLHRGEVIFATSNRIVDRLGECLLRARVITLEQLREAQRVWAPGMPTGKVLVERGFLTPRELWNGVKHQVEEIVRSLFTYPTGRVHFWEGTLQPDNIVRLSLPTRRLVAEALERRDGLIKYQARLELPVTRLVALPDAGGPERAGDERGIFEALAGGSSFPAVCETAGIDPLLVARTIQLLEQVGAVRVEQAGAAPAQRADEGTPQSEREALQSCVEAHIELLSELVRPLVEADGAGAVEQRLAHVVEEAAGRFPDFLLGLSVGPGAVLDLEELTQRALRLGGDRMRTVSSALGELVAYLEFELKNCPGIDDSSQVLGSLRELRAKIEI